MMHTATGDHLRISVVGAGTMGLGIAEVAARRGCSLTVVDALPEVLHGAPDRLQVSLTRAERKGLLTEPVTDICGRVAFMPDLESLADSDNLPAPAVIAQEIVEDLQAALEQFKLIAGDLDSAALIEDEARHLIQR